MLLFLIMYSVADLHIKIKFLSIKLYYQLTDCTTFQRTNYEKDVKTEKPYN
jgi:hypothetical protein